MARGLQVLLMAALTIVLPVIHGTAVQEVLNEQGLSRDMRDADRLHIFEQTFTLSEPNGLYPTVYALSTYYTRHFEALESCANLGGYLAEINSLAEMQFVANFLRDKMKDRTDVAISGYRASNNGTFRPLDGVELIPLINALDNPNGSPGNGVSPAQNFLFFAWHTNRPRRVGNLPSCLTIERRGDNWAMDNIRCDRDYLTGRRYLCEVELF